MAAPLQKKPPAVKTPSCVWLPVEPTIITPYQLFFQPWSVLFSSSVKLAFQMHQRNTDD